MSTVSRAQPPSIKTPKVLINGFSTSGWQGQATTPGPDAKTIISGALVANTLADVFNVTASGTLKFISASGISASNRTMRLVLTLDGVVVFDSTSAILTSSGATIVGCLSNVQPGGTLWSWELERIPFSTSARLQWASSVTETAQFTASVIYETD